jgi:hypothetical protein
MTPEQIEGLAVEILSCTSNQAPVDALLVAADFGLLARPGPLDLGVVGDEVCYDGDAPHRERHEFVIRCVARVILQSRDCPPTESLIAHLARAIMLPRGQFDARADFLELMRKHSFASLAMIGARKSDVFLARRQRAISAGAPGYHSS